MSLDIRSSACFRPWVFITSVCTVAPWLMGPMSWAIHTGQQGHQFLLQLLGLRFARDQGDVDR